MRCDHCGGPAKKIGTNKYQCEHCHQCGNIIVRDKQAKLGEALWI